MILCVVVVAFVIFSFFNFTAHYARPNDCVCVYVCVCLFQNFRKYFIFAGDFSATLNQKENVAVIDVLLLLSLCSFYCCLNSDCPTWFCVRFQFDVFFNDLFHDCVSRVVWLVGCTPAPYVGVAAAAAAYQMLRWWANGCLTIAKSSFVFFAHIWFGVVRFLFPFQSHSSIFTFTHRSELKQNEMKKNINNNNNSNENRMKCILCTHTQAHAHTTLYYVYCFFVVFSCPVCLVHQQIQRNQTFSFFSSSFSIYSLFLSFFLVWFCVFGRLHTLHSYAFTFNAIIFFFVLIIHIRSQTHTHTWPHGQVFTICSMCTIRISSKLFRITFQSSYKFHVVFVRISFHPEKRGTRKKLKKL